MARLRASLAKIVRPVDRASLAQVARQIRGLAAQNDPDVIRERLGAIADTLEDVAGTPPTE
jgi:hypothetical protein